jgi:acetyl esterase
LAWKLEELGVRVDCPFFPAEYSPAAPHEYQFNLDKPAGQKALGRLVAFVRATVQP